MERRLEILKDFISEFKNEIETMGVSDDINEIKNNISKEIIINKYDSPVFKSKAGTVMLLKRDDTLSIGKYKVDGPEAFVVDLGLSQSEAIKLGNKIVLTELSTVVKFEDTNLTFDEVLKELVPEPTINVKKELVPNGVGLVTNEGNSVKDVNGVIVDDEKEDYYTHFLLTDEGFVNLNVEDYNERYDELMDINNPIFVQDRNGNYTHVRGYNTVEEASRILDIVGDNVPYEGNNDDDAFEEKEAPVIKLNIFGKDKHREIDVKPEPVKPFVGLNIKGADGKSSTKFKSKNKTTTFSKVRTVEDINIV